MSEWAVGTIVPILEVRQMKIKVTWLLELGFESPRLFALYRLPYMLHPHPSLPLPPSVSRR